MIDAVPPPARMARRPGRADGFQLLEALVVVAVLGLVASWGIPRLDRWSSGLRVRLAAAECVAALRKARRAAISEGDRVGIKFRRQGERYTFTLYRDGDGDGVLTADIDRGIDPQIALERQLAHMGGDVRFGFPDGVSPTDPGSPGQRLDRLDDPIRFNRSDIASFSRLGESTPGSLYLTGGGHLAVVRLFGRTAKIKVLVYDRETERWSHR